MKWNLNTTRDQLAHHRTFIRAQQLKAHMMIINDSTQVKLTPLQIARYTRKVTK